MNHIELRPAIASDVDWLINLRIDTMGAYLGASGNKLTREDQRARVLQDFSSLAVIVRDDLPIGMIKVVRKPDLWRLVQVQVADADPEVMRYLNGGLATPRPVIEERILPGFMTYNDARPG